MKEIPGWLTPPEAAALRRAATGRLVLELGSYQGRSTAVLAEVAAHVVSVDHHRGSPEHQADPVFRQPWGTLPAFLEHLAAWRPRVSLMVMDLAQAGFFLPTDTFDLVFVDGAHDLESVGRDGAIALRALRPGGLAYFHDVVVGNGVYHALRGLGRPRPVAGSIWSLEA